MRLVALAILPNGIPAGTTFTENETIGRLLIQAGVARETDERPRLIKRLARKRDTTAVD
jgi:hypothetical protein